MNENVAGVSIDPNSGLITTTRTAPTEVVYFTATATDGSGVTAEAGISIESYVEPESIAFENEHKTISIGEQATLSTVVSPVNMDKKYGITWHSSNSSIATVQHGVVTGIAEGSVTITATITGFSVSASCTVKVVMPYEKQLQESCGFSGETVSLILKLYDKVDENFASESTLLRAWRCARLLSEFGYDYPKYGILIWDMVAGSVTTNENREAYFLNTLGYTESEYQTLKNGLSQNKEDADIDHNIIDFTHMQYALAARLAYILEKVENPSDVFSEHYIRIYDIYSGEDISYLGGWLGDAVITEIGEDGSTSMKNEDYMADLDAENIYRLTMQGRSAVDAINEYYSNMNENNTRADIFMQYISYNTVKEKVFCGLIDVDLYQMAAAASANSDFLQESYYLGLIANEQYHFDVIKAQYPDTYNFLKSLEDGLQKMQDYANAE